MRLRSKWFIQIFRTTHKLTLRRIKPSQGLALSMFRILKVTGDSMTPDFQEGDFVVLASAPFVLKRLKVGDTIVFEHRLYGRLIKRISAFDPETTEPYVEGTRPDSLDSRRLGTVRREAIRGKVIAHFPK
jgi:type IV secretory pathway protease TraF